MRLNVAHYSLARMEVYRYGTGLESAINDLLKRCILRGGLMGVHWTPSSTRSGGRTGKWKTDVEWLAHVACLADMPTLRALTGVS